MSYIDINGEHWNKDINKQGARGQWVAFIQGWKIA